MTNESQPKAARWSVTLYLEVPADGSGYDHGGGIDELVWEMREALRDKRGVWFEYDSKHREVVDDV